MTSVSQFARAILPSGTTTVVADPHEIANVLGTTGIDYMLESARNQPLIANHIKDGLPVRLHRRTAVSPRVITPIASQSHAIPTSQSH